MRAGVLATVVVAALAFALPAHASGPPTAWDGTNPFNCTLQQAGFGATVPDPGADPYCVDFDKRRQNISELGVADFLLNEPARVAAAVPKCFYFQSDHWRGSIVQNDGSTKTYEWDGHYFFDKARGEGGVWVTNFNLNGKTYDPSSMPGIPPDWSRYFGPGTGGVITHNQIPGDPNCAARLNQQPPVYAQSSGRTFAPPAGAPPAPCGPATGAVSAGRLGPATIGDADEQLRESLGDPIESANGVTRFCTPGRGKLVVLSRHGKAALILATGPGFTSGTRAKSLRRARTAARLGGGTRVANANGVLYGVRGGAVRFVAVYDRTAFRTSKRLAAALRLTR
jgi:hypothetical protein